MNSVIMQGMRANLQASQNPPPVSYLTTTSGMRTGLFQGPAAHLVGSILGGILAIPLAAALRVILARYVWDKAGQATT